MNIDTNKPTVYSLEDRLSFWRDKLENARKALDVDLIAHAKRELAAINVEVTAANTEAMHAAEEARREDRKIRDFIQDDGSDHEASSPWSEG